MAAIIALALLVTACGSDEGATSTPLGEGATGDDLATEPEPEPAVVGDSAQPEPETIAVDEPAAVELETTTLELGAADWTGLDEWVLPALGGLRLGVPADLVVFHDSDMVTVRTPFAADTGRYDPSMVLGLVAKGGSRDAVTSIDDMTSRLIHGIAQAEPTGVGLELFGETLEGWGFRLNPGVIEGPHFLYGAYPHGADGLNAWQPLPFGELFLAEVPDGVLAVGWTARSEEELSTARAIFDRIAPTLELSGPLGGDRPIEPLPAIEGEPIDPVALGDGIEAFDRLSQRLDAGVYTSANLGTPVSFTIGEGWWVQPNFPGWVVLTGDESFGPGDRGLELRVGVEQLVPTHRSGAAGEPMTFDPATWIDDPPPGIEVSQHRTVEIDGALGTVIDFVLSPDASCSPEEPCEYALLQRGPYPPLHFRKGIHNRLWHLTEGVSLPITIVAGAPRAEWLDVAGEVVVSLDFLSDG